MTAEIEFVHANGDLDLEILDDQSVRITRSTSVDDDESATFSIDAGQTVFVRVYGFQDAPNANYTLKMKEGDPNLIAGSGIWSSGDRVSGDEVDILIADSRIERNVAVEGGGIRNESGGKLTIDDSIVSHNSAASAKGAVLDDFFNFTPGRRRLHVGRSDDQPVADRLQRRLESKLSIKH